MGIILVVVPALLALSGMNRCHAILEAKLMLRGPGGVWIGKQ
jgi:hypothetical protein